jgi:hypothetical protein
MPDRLKEKGFEAYWKVGIKLGDCNLPFGRLLLQAGQFGMGSGGISLESNEKVLGLLQLALPLLLLLQKLGNLALQLLNFSLVSGIPVVQLLGHIH